MRTPKYRFLLGGTLDDTNFSKGYYRDRQTGDLIQDPSGNLYCSSTIYLLDYDKQHYAFFDKCYNGGSYLCAYDSQGTYLGYIMAETAYLQPVSLPAETASIIFTFSPADHELNPSLANAYHTLAEYHPNYSNLSKVIERQSEQMFFRETLSTDLHFIGSEADTLAEISAALIGERFVMVCERYDFEAHSWSVYHCDTFSTMDCRFDAAAHICTPSLTPLDRYTDLIAKYSDEYDLVKLNPEITQIETSLRPVIEIYERGSRVITRFLGGTYWETEVNDPIDDEDVLRGVEHFERRPLSEAEGYMEVAISEEWSQIGIPTGIYEFDSANNYYFRVESGDFWAWSFASVDGAPHLVLSKNGAPVQGDGMPVLALLPNNVSDASDLPASDYDNSYPIGFGPLLTPQIGAVVRYRLFDLWLRVIGRGDTLFGVSTFDIPKDDFAVNSPAYKKCAPLGKDQGYFYLTGDTTPEPTEFGITENEGEYYTRENLPVEGGIEGVKPMPVGRYEWGRFSFWYNYADNYVTNEEASRYDYLIKDCYTLDAVINALLKKIDNGISFAATSAYSLFLYGSQSQMTSDYNWQLALTQKSNVLKGDYDQPAKKAPITFESLMGLLRDQYDLYWYVDDQRRLHIEHKLFFLNGGSYVGLPQIQLDFTGNALSDKFNKKRIAYFQNSFSYEKKLMLKRLEFSTAEKGTEFFTGLAIDVENDYAKLADTQSFSIGDFTSDLDLMRVEPSQYSSDGFTLLAYESLSQNNCKVEVRECKVTDHEGNIRVAYINNLFASWLFCQHFHLYDATGNRLNFYLRLNSLATMQSFDFLHGYVWAKRQELQFPSDQDPDTLLLIKTDVGYGMPEKFEVNALTRQVKATLSFPIALISQS